jgi:hypothetical protein
LVSGRNLWLRCEVWLENQLEHRSSPSLLLLVLVLVLSAAVLGLEELITAQTSELNRC